MCINASKDGLFFNKRAWTSPMLTSSKDTIGRFRCHDDDNGFSLLDSDISIMMCL